MNLIPIRVANLILFFLISTTVFADVKVLVIPKGSKAAFWGKVCEGAQQAGVDLAIRVTLRGPYTEDQHTAQIEIIEYGIRKNFNAIVLAPTHVDRTGPVLKKAVEKGIKIVLIDSNMNTLYHTSIVESDNYKAGQMAADHAGFLVGGTGNVVLARHMKHQASTHARERGFLDTIKSQYPQVNVIADSYMGASVGSAYRIMLDLFDRFSTIDAIISVGEEATLGILRALESRDLKGKIKFIGFDFNITIRNAILNHEMDATIAQNPFQIGYIGVKTAHQLTQNEAVPPKIYTDTTLINTQNYQTPNVQTIINSNISQSELQKELK